MSLTKQHFEAIAKLVVFLETKEFATQQDIKAFVKTELKQFCYDFGKNFNGPLYDSIVANRILAIRKEIGLKRLSDVIPPLNSNQL